MHGRDDPKGAGTAAGAAAVAPRPPPAGDLARGTNQSGVRLYNERLVLSLIRRHESLPKAEIARLTGLSPQTITVIMRALEADGLVVKRNRQRGKIGQPSVPFALNPDGALSLGVKIGRRSADIILMDFTGGVRATLRESYQFPSPEFIIDFVAGGIDQAHRRPASGSHRRRRRRHSVRIVELGTGGRRAARGDAGLARRRHQGGDRGGVEMAGLCLQ